MSSPIVYEVLDLSFVEFYDKMGICEVFSTCKIFTIHFQTLLIEKFKKTSVIERLSGEYREA
jgi:hypothetical protein